MALAVACALPESKPSQPPQITAEFIDREDYPQMMALTFELTNAGPRDIGFMEVAADLWIGTVRFDSYMRNVGDLYAGHGQRVEFFFDKCQFDSVTFKFQRVQY